MIERQYNLTFRSPVSVFSGLAVAGLVDRMVVRDSNGLPYVPGSTVKGRWKFTAERLLQSQQMLKNAPSTLRFHGHGRPLCKSIDSACTICRLFGNASIPSSVWVGQAVFDKTLADDCLKLLKTNPNPVVHPDAEIRPGIGISRVRRAAIGDHLFFDEAIPAVTFSGKILFDHLLEKEEMEFLIASAKMVDAMGGRKAAGRGILEGGILIQWGAV